MGRLLQEIAADCSAEAELVGGGEAEEKDVLLEVLGARAVVLPLVAVGRIAGGGEPAGGDPGFGSHGRRIRAPSEGVGQGEAERSLGAEFDRGAPRGMSEY